MQDISIVPNTQHGRYAVVRRGLLDPVFDIAERVTDDGEWITWGKSYSNYETLRDRVVDLHLAEVAMHHAETVYASQVAEQRLKVLRAKL